MTAYVIRNGKVVEKQFAEPVSAPSVISDEMTALRHMADGKHYTSKSKFRAATKAAGCIEVGSDVSVLRPRKPITMDRGQRRDDIRRSIYELRNGRHQAR